MGKKKEAIGRNCFPTPTPIPTVKTPEIFWLVYIGIRGKLGRQRTETEIAVAVCGPFGAVKELASGLYAQNLAGAGLGREEIEQFLSCYKQEKQAAQMQKEQMFYKNIAITPLLLYNKHRE